MATVGLFCQYTGIYFLELRLPVPSLHHLACKGLHKHVRMTGGGVGGRGQVNSLQQTFIILLSLFLSHFESNLSNMDYFVNCDCGSDV